MAGAECSACHEGITCMRSDCAFAHPSKALQCTRRTGSIPVGAEVFAKPKDDAIFPFEWSIGTVCSFRESAYKVDFPEVKNWAVEEKDLRLAMSGSSSDGRTAHGVPMDDSFYKLGFASSCGKVGGKFRFTGNVDKSQDRHRWEYGFVHGEQELTPSRHYFEVKIVADTPSGVCIGLTGSSFSAGSMVGWCHPWIPTSIGFHSDNGKLYGGPNKGKKGAEFGPTSSKGDSIGCGINFDVDGKPKTVFFTRNKKKVGWCEWQSEDLLFPVVTSASPAEVQVNLTATLPYDSASAKPANPKTSDELTTSANTSNTTLSAETTNCARYRLLHRLLYGISAQVMVNIFKASYQKEAGAPWDVKIAVSFVNNKITGNHKIRTGKCEDWDLTLLTSLLLFEPGYMKGISTARDAIEKLREARNSVAHHPHYQANQSIPKADFDKKWHIVSEALDVLINQLSPKQKNASRQRIHEIQNEKIRQSDVEASGEMIKYI